MTDAEHIARFQSAIAVNAEKEIMISQLRNENALLRHQVADLTRKLGLADDAPLTIQHAHPEPAPSPLVQLT